MLMSDRKVWEFTDYSKMNRELAFWNAAKRATTADANPAEALRQFGLPTGESVTPGQGLNQWVPNDRVQTQAQEFLNDPAAAEAVAEQMIEQETGETSLVDRGKSMLARVFDYEDKADLQVGPVNLRYVESAWDGMLKSFDWAYDRLNQLTVAGISGLPGGIETVSWDEADDISVGQAFLGSMGQAAGRFERGELTAGDIAVLPATVFSAAAAQLDTDSPIQDATFDITNPEDREAAFVEDSWGKWTSGLLDASFVIFGDPLIVGGKFAKVTRLRYIDRPLTQANKAKMIDELDTGIRTFNNGGNVRKEAPIFQTLYRAVVPDADGNLPSASRIIEEAEIADSTDAAGIASALEQIQGMGLDDAGRLELGSLVFKTALQDTEAMTELASRSALTLETLMSTRRERVMQELLVDPSRREALLLESQKSLRQAEEYFDIVQRKFDEGGITQAEYRRAQQNVDQLRTLRDDLENGQMPGPLDYPEPAGSAAAEQQIVVLKAMEEQLSTQNEFFRNALQAEQQGAFFQADRGFASNTALGRAVSNRRTRRAQRRYEVKSTAANGWRHRDFFGNGITTHIVRMWTRASLENPTAYVTTKSTGAMNSWKNIEAMLNKMVMYSDDADLRFVQTVTDDAGKATEVPIGGITRKEQLFSEFIGNMGRSQDTSLATEMLERAIVEDMIRYYGLDSDIVQKIIQKTYAQYDDYADMIQKTNGYFPDGTSVSKVLNVAPNLPSQLAEGKYLLPVEEIEKVVRNLEKGKIKDFDAGNIFTARQKIGQPIDAALSAFNDVWRPAVLFRLGYPQRNVAEGIFRSMAFNSSFAPIAWAGRAGIEGFSNFRKAKRAARKAAQVRAKQQVPDEARAKFDELATEQEALIKRSNRLSKVRKNVQDMPERGTINFTKQSYDDVPGSFYVSENGQYRIEKDGSRWFISEVDPATGEIMRYEQSYKSLKAARTQIDDQEFGVGFVEDELTGARFSTVEEVDAEILRTEARVNQISDELEEFGGRPVPAALKNANFTNWRDAQLEEYDDQIFGMEEWARGIQQMADEGLIDIDDIVEQNLRYNRMEMLRLERERKLLERDDVVALSRWEAQGAPKKFKNRGGRATREVRPGLVLNDAYDGVYGAIARANASADNTMRATLAMRLQTMRHIFVNTELKGWNNIDPSQGAAYWEGLSAMLRQYSTTALGKKLLSADSDEDIVVWLLGPEGKTTREALDDAFRFGLSQRLTRSAEHTIENPITGKKVRSTADIEDRIGDDPRKALSYVQQMREALQILTAGDESVARLALDHAPSADELRRILSGRDNLQPVVGFTEELNGRPTVMAMINNLSAKGFQYIGVMPEDAFVRMPFYKNRYRDTRDALVDDLIAQYDSVDQIPAEFVNNIMITAHRRALKDTKEFLYTIDRRTNLGRYGEVVFPFISAQQNAITTLGKLTRRDPALPGMLLLLWRAPTQVGWEDEEGNIVIPLPTELVPESFKDAAGKVIETVTFGTATIPDISEMKIAKAGLNSIFPESGFAFVPRPQPLVQVGASELMKRSLFIGPEAPDILVNFLGEEDADTLYQYFKDYIFGEVSGLSTEPLSYDKALPPWMQKALQMIRSDSAAQYGFQYGLQARTADLEWQAQYRDDYPSNDEIAKKTNGMFWLRMLGNLLGYTSPQYETPVNTLIDIQNKFDQVYGLDGPMKFSQTFGNELLYLGETKSTRNIGGALATSEVIRNIKKYEKVIGEVAPDIGDDLDVLGMLINGDAANSEYDPNAYRWQLQATIPGTSQNWREVASGPEGMAEAQRQAGWVEYIKGIGQIDALLQQAGLPNYRVKEAARYKAMKDQFTQNLLDNPMYEPWAVDFASRGSSTTYSAVRTIKAALEDEAFMNDNADKRTWQIAALYMSARDEVIRMAEASGEGLGTEGNAELKFQWDTLREEYKQADPGWAAIANRYLRQDDDPTQIGRTTSMGGLGG